MVDPSLVVKGAWAARALRVITGLGIRHLARTPGGRNVNPLLSCLPARLTRE